MLDKEADVCAKADRELKSWSDTGREDCILADRLLFSKRSDKVVFFSSTVRSSTASKKQMRFKRAASVASRKGR